jgi:hypothetical protein
MSRDRPRARVSRPECDARTCVQTCALGLVSRELGATNCFLCDAGSVPQAGQSACGQCARGRYADDSTFACEVLYNM